MTRMAVQLRSPQGRRAGRLTEVEVPEQAARMPGTHRAFTTASGCRVIVSRVPLKVASGRIEQVWHLSISHKHRYPTWDEIADVRYELVPNEATMAMLLPPREQYANLHGKTFQMWQIDTGREGDGGIDLWRSGTGHAGERDPEAGGGVEGGGASGGADRDGEAGERL